MHGIQLQRVKSVEMSCARINVRHDDDAQYLFYSTGSSSAQVRAAHQLQGSFDVSPGFRLLPFTLLLAVAGLLSSLDDCRIAVRLQQLSRVIVDFHFSNPHDAVLLSFDRRTQRLRLKRLDIVIERELIR